jgi:excisionase family DNA binding protein
MALREREKIETAVGEDEVWDVPYASEFTKIKVNTFYKLLLARKIPSLKLGKLRRVRKSDVLAYLNAHRVEALN